MARTKSRTHWRVVPLLVVGAGTIGAIVLAQNNRKPDLGPAAQVNTDRKSAPDVEIVPAKAERRPLVYYTGGVRSDLFTAPVQAPVEPPKVELPKTDAIVAAPVIVNPFADYAYTGTVQVNGLPMALVENTKTKDGQYLKAGDSFLGGVVAEITDRTVSIKVGDKPQILSKSDQFTVAQLDKNAPYLQTGGQPGQPAQTPPAGGPGMPGFGAGGPGGPGGMAAGFADRMRQRMESMPAEQRQQIMDRWMNSRFEGRGGGGERRGGRRERGGEGGGGASAEVRFGG